MIRKLRELGSDLLSPIIIKELRQELRLKSFTFLFLVPQAMMLFALSLQLIDMDNPKSASGLPAVLFWGTLAVPLTMMIPRRAFFSFHKELEARSLELVLLTRLSAWKLVTGKWAALSLQSLLFLTAISPFVVLRYFLGDTNPLATVQVIFFLFLASLLLTALGVSGSAAGGRRRQMAPPLFMMIIFGYPILMLLERGTTGSGAALLSWADFVMLLLLVPLGIMLLLEVGIAHIAPALENYAMRKRSLSLLALGIATLLSFWGSINLGLLGFVISIILAPVCISSLFEEVYPLFRRGLKKKISLADWMRYPGWPGGTLFSLILIGIVLILLTCMGLIKSRGMIGDYILIAGGFLQPLAIMLVVLPPAWRTITIYLAVQMIQATFASIFWAYQAYLLFAIFPLSVVTYRNAAYSRSEVPVFVGYLSSLVIFIVIFYKFLSLLRSIERRRLRVPTLPKPQG
jgi:hypothetical protein